MGSKSGIYAQAGFVFQKQVFLYKLIDLRSNDAATFEGLDDVSVDSQRAENESLALVGLPKRKLVQVKAGNVSATAMMRVVCNWVLATEQHSDIDGYELVVPCGCKVDSAILSEDARDVYADILEKSSTKKNKNALYKQIKEGVSENDFMEIFSKIKACDIAPMSKGIDRLLEEKLEDILHKGTDECSGKFYEQRVEELQREVFYAIDKCMKERKGFSVTKEVFRDMCNDVVERISVNRYDPDFELFAADLNVGSLLDEGGRHVQQLTKCELDQSDMEAALCEMAYYSAIRQFRLERMGLSRQTAIEKTAHGNFRHAVMRLGAMGQDNPTMRFVETRDSPNERCSNEQEKWGACVYLTRDDAEKKYQITWWDKEVHGAS